MKDIIDQVFSNLHVSCGIPYFIIDYLYLSSLDKVDCSFCQKWHKLRGCDPVGTHTYGIFEAERWNGLYIYYCPIGLVFISSIIYSKGQPRYAVIFGPAAMNSYPDFPPQLNSSIQQAILDIPLTEPAKITAISKTQWNLSNYLSDAPTFKYEIQNDTHSMLNNVMYDIISNANNRGNLKYPIEIEQKLQNMIKTGDKQGARELINELLGTVYFESGSNFNLIKQRATELVILFSRAAIDGGADISQIFGHSNNLRIVIENCSSIYELSEAISTIFYRFIGYVFEFEKIKFKDIIYKSVSFIRENYASKITLSDVADHVYLSKTYLSKVFKDELNTSFTSYINSVRIEKSKELLVSTDLPLSDIAVMTGFNDQSYFTKIFRKITGMSPGGYRKSGGRSSSIRK